MSIDDREGFAYAVGNSFEINAATIRATEAEAKAHYISLVTDFQLTPGSDADSEVNRGVIDAIWPHIEKTCLVSCFPVRVVSDMDAMQDAIPLGA